MNRRNRLAATVGVLLTLALALGGWLGAAADTPEGGSSTVNVTPSDDLPVSSLATVVLEGAFTEGTVTAAQCYPTFESCGPDSELFPTAVTGQYIGDLPVVRFLTVFDPGAGATTTIDCAKVVCEVWITRGFFGSHHLTFSPLDPTTTTVPPRGTTTTAPATTTTAPKATTTVTPTTTTRPPPTTTTRPGAPTTTTTRPAQPGVTIPPTTRVTVAPTTTVRPGATSTTTAPTTTTTVPPPAGDGPTLVAVTTKNQPSGPPGGGLQVRGSGYACPTVYFFFDGTRVGSAEPDGAGNVSKGGLSVPGDTSNGTHRVTSSCDPAGDTVAKAAVFEVLPVSVHRPAFVTSLPRPDQVSVDPGQLAFSAAVAMGAIMLIAFPFELFNSTMEENYDEIRSWFGMGPRGVPEVVTRSHFLSFFGLTALSAAVCGFLSPDFGFNMTSLVLFAGMFVALLVMAVLFSVPADIGVRRQFGEWGKLNFLPGSVIVSIVLVLASRLLDFQPGYFYGALAGLAFRSALSENVQGKMTGANWLFSLVVSVAAFFLRVPVSSAAAEPGGSILWIGVEICLALIFLWGVEGLAVAMLPMKFLDGRKVFLWSKPAWAALFFLGVFATVHVLLRPGSGYVGETSGEVGIGVMALFAGFGVVSVGLWAYFRFRPARWAPAQA